MNFKKFFNNRFNVLYLIIVFMLFVLAFRMAVLTIVNGEEYRKIADIKKIKDIPVKAPRGKIYDRNGQLLADNISSFTVKMYIDEIDKKHFNEVSYTLSSILDRNGERPIDEFPIKLDTYEYIDENAENNTILMSNLTNNQGIDTKDYKTAEEKVIETVKSNIRGWLNYNFEIYEENFNLKQKVLEQILKDNKDLPIELVGNKFVVKQFNNNDTTKAVEEGKKNDLQLWLEKNNLSEKLSPEDVIIEKLKSAKIINALFSNSKIRRLSYDFLQSKGLLYNVRIVDFSFVQDEQYKKIKKSLNNQYKEITSISLAKDDFVLLTMIHSIDNILSSIYKSGQSTIKPGEILLDKLKEVYVDIPVKVIKQDNILTYEYNDEESKNRYLVEKGYDLNTTAYELVKKIAVDDYHILYNTITDDNIKYFAQTELLKFENPSISVSEWEYTPIKSKNLWINKNIKNSEEILKNSDAKEVFYLLKQNLKIDEKINDYDVRNMMVLWERYNKTSYLSYHPVDICYGATEKTVAMISERSHDLIGINVEIEPLRIYPTKETASHLIGYLGKIAQDYEVEEFIKKKGYSSDDIIGKTGLEEKFEDYLRGENGKKTVEVNNVGKSMRSVSSVAPVPGDDLHLTIDLNLQKKTEESLKKGLEQIQVGGVYTSEWGDFYFRDKYVNAKSGAIVAVDVKTGELLALANYPSYDLNLFSTGITSEDWNSLLSDSKNPLAPRPLYNIAMLSAIQPGSTFKMITALAALQKGVNPNTPVYCAGTMEVGDRHFACWIYNMYKGAHGYQTMYEAIMNSCNFYCYTTMIGENLATNQSHPVKVDAEDIIKMADEFGLNDKTGIEIDIPQEASGGVPSIEGKKITTKFYLRLFLENNINKYVSAGMTMDEVEKKEKIEKIVSWIDEEEPYTRSEVYTGLEEAGLDPNKTNEKGVPLVDIIKYSYINQAWWNIGDNLNISIGQGNNSYTTLQMANYIATIANGGYNKNISVIKDVKKYNGEKTDYIPKREENKVEISDDNYLEIVKKGMLMVSEGDAAKPYSRFPVKVASKTGTAQKEGINPDTGNGYDEFAWYVAFAPYDDPQIAVACVLFEGGSGRYPIPIVREVIGEYLKNKK